MVQSRLRPLAWLATLGSIGASTVLIAACSGKVSNGSVKSTSQPVSVGDVSGTANPCPSGSAHPNVCCESGPNQATSCVVYPNAPFTQCTSGTTAYPDPRTCCPLDGNGQCAVPPPQSLPSDGGVASGGSCVYPCPVGWYSPPDSSGSSSSGGAGGGVTCCETASDGSSSCVGSGGGTSGGGCTCACPSCDSDGSCPPCPPCNCPSQGPSPAPSCDACPPGWQTPQGEPLLCCSEGPDGTISCFSQGVPPPPPGDEGDAGVTVPASCFGGGGGSEDGGTFTQCGCSETVGSTQYNVTCTSGDDGGGTCTCSTGTGSGGSTTGTVIPQPSTACDDVGALFSACGFPSSGVNCSGSGGTGSSGSGSAGGSSSSSSGG
jgi:hypothetical protein